MLIHISSGKGIPEVTRAVWHFKQWLEKRYNFEVIEEHLGDRKHSIVSLLIKSDDKVFLKLVGTVLWKVKSPFRAKYKRKNWYFSVCCYSEEKVASIDECKIVYQTMKSPKKGGQHVNTTCSGVRATYPPLGLDAVAYDERSQHRNKVLSKARLLEKIALCETKKFNITAQERWRKSKEVQRGDSVLVFEGAKFMLST